ncbi:MAG: glycerophosphodiester phosphodiesterase [Deltaproteobacteria bacterium]|uniref:Glycerophosphodiester phosphodiesterase n=1 Tax=Candidatus Zymogenus saltonus TaxID=2844893 RepID=A0A9D8KCN6_9DELT|nr:glycerophosphodiester phosphodiesterase [Candidatus Zymogenus saltonus]
MKPKPFLKSKPPIIFAHRGAHARFPENTIPAFEEALRVGTNYIETDTQLTRDGVPILHHDDNVVNLTGEDRFIRDLTLKELKKLDAGYTFSPDGGKSFPHRGKGIHIPSLEEVLRKFDLARFNIDIKDGTAESAKVVLYIVKRHKAGDRVLLASFAHPALAYIRKEAPEIATSACRKEVVRFLIDSLIRGKRVKAVPYDALQVPEKQHGIKVVNRRLLKGAKALGLQVHVWTINDEETMKRLLKLGVDGIITDRPDIALQVARSFKNTRQIF